MVEPELLDPPLHDIDHATDSALHLPETHLPGMYVIYTIIFYHVILYYTYDFACVCCTNNSISFLLVLLKEMW